MYILAQNESIRGAMERFQHSSETISRYFSKGIHALVSLTAQIIKLEDPSFATTLEQIANSTRYMSYFKNCIGAIDGTHVDARIPNHEKVAYIGLVVQQRKMSWLYATSTCVLLLWLRAGKRVHMTAEFSLLLRGIDRSVSLTPHQDILCKGDT
ncbi:uncharacterized protein LOC110024187 [Phalaenopsis equestris]|uniref:uncharacterized protein LOC110024187 n=1 Tax=Phalaenopsis equestris TaxID=78828 RepID=UPI0009E19BFC|nr:uncharacterized protein LOC110024187 [Phalaenopsis equestris]